MSDEEIGPPETPDVLTVRARPDGAPFDDLGESFENLVSIGWIADDEQVIEYPRGKAHLTKTCRFAAETPFCFSPTLSA